MSPGKHSVNRQRSLSLRTSSMYVMASVVVTSGLGFVYWVAAARLFSKDTVGVGSSAVSAVNLTSVIASCGLGIFLIHRLPASRGRDWSRLVSRVTVLIVVLGTVAGLILPRVLVLVSAHYRVASDSIWGSAAFFVFVVGQVASVESDALALAERRADCFFLRAVLFSAFKLALLPAAKVLPVNATVSILGGWGLSAVLSTAVVGGLLLRQHRPGFSFLLRGPRDPLLLTGSEVSQHWMTTLGGQLPQFALPVVVLARGGPGVSASFYIGWTIGASVFVVSSSVSQALLAEGRHSEQPLGVLLRRSARLIATMQIPAITLMAVVGPYLLHLFGKTYLGSAVTLIRVLAVAAVFDGITNIGITVARLRGRFGYASIMNVGMAVVALVMAYLLVPSRGAVAGGLAYGAANVLGSVCVIYALYRLLRRGELTTRPAPESAQESELESAPGPEREPEVVLGDSVVLG